MFKLLVLLFVIKLYARNDIFNTGTLSSFARKFMSLDPSSNKINSKFKTSCRFAVVNANAKFETAVASSESVKTAFVHLDFPLILSQCSISAMLITPIVLNRLLFMS